LRSKCSQNNYQKIIYQNHNHYLNIRHKKSLGENVLKAGIAYFLSNFNDAGEQRQRDRRRPARNSIKFSD